MIKAVTKKFVFLKCCELMMVYEEPISQTSKSVLDNK